MYAFGVLSAIMLGGLFLFFIRNFISGDKKLPKPVVFILYPVVCLCSWVGVCIILLGILCLVIVLIVESDWFKEDI